MKYLAFIFFFGMAISPLFSQNIKATPPARLLVYVTRPDGTQAMMNSDYLAIGYDNLQMTGELLLKNLNSDDEALKNLIDSAEYEKITFTGTIPDGSFVFHDMLNSSFDVETDLTYGDRQSRVLFGFIVSNRNTSLANTFDITCTGTISLRDDLGITRETGLEDKISFQFFQNVIVTTY